MLIYISLFFLFLAGIGACGVPKQLFNLETTLSSGKLQIWLTVIKAFGIPLSLLLLRFTKNYFVTLACALWGLALTLFSLVLIFDISDLAPSVNIYGVLFVTLVFICSLSLSLFSSIELSKVLKKRLAKSESSKIQPPSTNSQEVEGTYQTPTNPS
ncbi:MAG: hypothetical protein ACKOA8_14850 [Deltaproteobacteria bacterium]